MKWNFLFLLIGYAAASLTYEEMVRQQHEKVLENQRLKQLGRQMQNNESTKADYTAYQVGNSSIIITVNTKSDYIITSGNPPMHIQPTRLQNQMQTSQVPQNQYNQMQTTQTSLPPRQYNPDNSGSALPTVVGVSSTSNNLHEKFNTKLFQNISPNNIRKNVVYSPISLQTLMALVSLGAKDQTAFELFQGLQLPSDKTSIANIFENLLKTDKLSQGSHLIMANKIYYSNKVHLRNNFKNIAENSFDSEIERINFRNPVNASLRINAWVNRKTNGYIQDIVTPDILDAQSQMVLVNAIYFKAVWAKEFSVADTLDDEFFVTPNEKVKVKMMYAEDKFRYGHFTDLKASVLEMPYKDSDLSMMIILPDVYDGLEALEKSLNNIDLSTLAASLFKEQVVLRLPKFRIQFEVDMVEPLKNLNIRTIFSTNSDLSDMFTDASNQPLGVSKVQHKAYIDVNEAGSEAAAASFANVMPLSLSKTVTMSVNHPFIFAIRNSKAVYFTGHVANPTRL